MKSEQVFKPAASRKTFEEITGTVKVPENIPNLSSASINSLFIPIAAKIHHSFITNT